MRSLLLASSLLSGAVLAAEPLTVVRTSARVTVDGKLDEAAWSAAPAFSTFVENFPSPGATPSLRTEARVLVDDQYLYVGVTCADPEPNLIVRQLGRRDSTPTADVVEIAIDSSGDRRTAFAFSVNASGVLRDRLLFADFNSTDTWDAVWDGAASVGPSGWSAELAIPLRVLRFGSGAPWSAVIRRTVPRTHQVFESHPIPREANTINNGALVVSRFGPLAGLDGLTAPRAIEVTPYVAARSALRPMYSDPTRPTPRLLDPSFDVGVDLKVALSSKVLLSAAVNPDFGQVEADQVIQNLSTAEQFFPEKRPFFLQGLDVFQPVGAEYGSPQQLFYSRRIGLEAPILGAMKLTGTLFKGLDIGLLDAVALGPGNPSMVPLGYSSPDPETLATYEASPDRRWQLHASRPFHLGPNDALPMARPQPTNYLAAVARQRFWESSSAGVMLTAATPLGPRCYREEFASDEDFRSARCDGRGANALGVDWNLRTGSGEWGFFGQAEASQQVGGTVRTLADGTRLAPGDFGYGGHLRAGKLGGEPFRFDVTYVYEDPKLDLNAMGFQPLSNYHWADLNLHYVKPSGVGRVRNLSVDYNLDLNWSADGRALPRGINTNVSAQVQLPSYDWVGARVGLEKPQFDTREIYGSGVPFERLTDLYVAVWVTTDPNRKLSLSGDVFGYRLFPEGQQPGSWGWGWDATLVWRPTERLETRLDGSYGHKPQGARFLELANDRVAVFGAQDPAFLSLTLRQQLVITPRLTLQAYAQLFSDVVRYGPFYAAPLDGVTTVAAAAVSPFPWEGGTRNSHASSLNVNVVLRWEYRLGSTLFLVYSHSQQEFVPRDGVPLSTSEWPVRLFDGPAVDTVMLKWSFWWAV